MSAVKLTDHITCLTFKKLYPVFVWAISCEDDGYLLVDTGFNNSDVESELKRASFHGAPKAIIITHCHLDHTGSVEALARKWKVPVVASAVESPFIDGSRKLAQQASGVVQRGFLGLADRLKMMTGVPVQVTRQVSEGDQIDGLRVIEIPGHTPGQIALVHEGDGAVIVADAFINYKNRVRQDPMPGVDIDREEAKRSIAKLSALGYENLLPSHGKPILGNGTQKLKEFLND